MTGNLQGKPDRHGLQGHGGPCITHCSCHDEDDVLPCCICGELSDDYEGNDYGDDDPDGDP